MRDRIHQASLRGDLLLVDYLWGSQRGNDWVVLPQELDDKALVGYCYTTESSRKFKLKQLKLKSFSPELIEGRLDPAVKHFRWLFGGQVPRLFRLGWLISVDEEHSGVYPRAKGDTVMRCDPFSEHRIHLQYIKSERFPFHVWSHISGDYRRYNNLGSAQAYFMQLAAKQAPRRIG